MQETNEVFEKNLAEIEKRSPEMAEKIRNHVPCNIDFVQALSGDIVMVYNGLPLHSMEDPILEAKKTYESVKETGYNTFNVIFGLGLGYLFKRATLETKGSILVYEPHMDVLRATLEVVDFSEELSRKNVWFVDELKYVRAIFPRNFYRGDFVGIQMLTTYRIAFPDLLRELTLFMQDLYRDSVINQQTMLHKTKKWSLAALNNIFDILKSPNQWLLEDKLKGVPAVLVSAGPSLDYALETLKEVQDKVIIIAVGQALKALDRAGIRPHLVHVIENLNVSQQFEGASCLDQLTVVLQPMTHRSIYKLPVKRHMINYPKGDNIAKWFGRNTNRDVKGYPNRGSVSFCAYYCAFHAGCEPMILVGQDLAYREGKCYASNSSYADIKYELDENGKIKYSYNEETYEKIGKTFDMDKEEFLTRAKTSIRDTIKVKGWNGEDLYTSVSYDVFLNNYRDIAECELPKFEKVLINCSVGGAYIEGLEHMTFKEALERCNLDHGVDIDRVIDEIYEESRITDDDIVNFFRAIERTKVMLNDARKIAKSSLETADKILTELEKPQINEAEADKLIIKLGKGDKKVIDIISKTELINPFISWELFEYSSAYNRSVEIENPENKIPNLINNIEQSAKLYKAIISGADQINEILPQIVENNKHILEEINAKKAKKC